MKNIIIKLLLLLFIFVKVLKCRVASKSGEESSSGPSEDQKGRYSWKTGNWGVCYASKGANTCGQGIRERPVWCVDGEQKTTLEIFCAPQKQPDRVKDCFTACRHKKDKLKWEVSQWTPCQEAENRAHLEFNTNNHLFPDAKDIYGIMQRTVSCILISHEDVKMRMVVDEDNCFTVARKPDPVKLCNIPKPQDCVVTDYRGWSACRGCSPDLNRTRIRSVIIAPTNGGKPCPALSETRPCAKKTHCETRIINVMREDYRLRLGAWRRCEPGHRLQLSNTKSENGSSDNYRYRVEKNLLLTTYDVSSSGESSEKQIVFQPQVGYQIREVLCKDQRGSIVHISLCAKSWYKKEIPARTRVCVVSQDCIVDDWNSWSKIQEGCIEPNGSVRPEIHERSRQVLKLPEGDGKPCPHLLERKHHSVPSLFMLCASKYKIVASPWSNCISTQGSEQKVVTCGGGIQLREISCVLALTGQPVNMSLCSFVENEGYMSTVQRCEIACPRDCIVDNWSKWSPCYPENRCTANDSTPNMKGYRERKRQILVQPSDNGVPCPATSEVQPCEDASCFQWVIGQWSSCEIDENNKCGYGQRRRNLKCQNIYNDFVDESLCARSQNKPESTKVCLIPCPYDCVLSEWSEWSPCSHSCSGTKMIALKRRNRTIIAPVGNGGQSCPNPDELTEMEPCNTHSCFGYSWFTLPWSECRRDTKFYLSSSKVENSSWTEEDRERVCEYGIQTREVWCLENNDSRAPDYKCTPIEKPVTLRSCAIKCPIDCEMSPWSTWSPCNEDCVPVPPEEAINGEPADIQIRTRIILREAANGGARCGELVDLLPCPMTIARCKHYEWQLTDWSECQLPYNTDCGQGFRTRGVWCSKNYREKKVSPTLCVEKAGPMPELSEKCSVDCKYSCIFSQWSAWSSCPQPCVSTNQRKRTRALLSVLPIKEACRDTSIFPVEETANCSCETSTTSETSEWSECIIEDDGTTVGYNGRERVGTCGIGTRYRRNICKNSDGDVVEPQFCEFQDDVESESCSIPCPVDCVQTEWSPWEQCSSMCGTGYQNRTRYILQEAENGGRPCGPNFETRVCSQHCSNYHWVASGFTQCTLIPNDEGNGCGIGDQFRTVRCMDFSSGNDEVKQVKNVFCDPLDRPSEVESCKITCPADCVPSEWSSWSTCSDPCDPSKYRDRSRSIIRSSTNPNNFPQYGCASLVEAQACVLNTTCFTYSWVTSEYGSCLPIGGSSCGEGVQSRSVFCERSDGRIVSDSYCYKHVRPTPVEKWCYIDCPIDCELSPWSEWNSTQCQCGKTDGMETRTRKIITKSSETGRPCPTNLIQRIPCPALPCYIWRKELWSRCHLEGSSCGHGTSYRNVTCIRGRITTDDKYCLQPYEQRLIMGGKQPKAVNLENNGKIKPSLKYISKDNLSNAEKFKLDIHTEISCYVACYGDCEVSEWSKWSHCHRNCHEQPSVGYQSRSKAVLKEASPGGEKCPDVLWQTRPCHTGPCFKFNWVVYNNTAVCKRSDGLITFGGCDEKTKPCLVDCKDKAPSPCQNGNNNDLKCKTADDENKVDDTKTQSKNQDDLQLFFFYPSYEYYNVWMFLVIGIGILFILFVFLSVVFICKNTSSNNDQRFHLLNLFSP